MDKQLTDPQPHEQGKEEEDPHHNPITDLRHEFQRKMGEEGKAYLEIIEGLKAELTALKLSKPEPTEEEIKNATEEIVKRRFYAGGSLYKAGEEIVKDTIQWLSSYKKQIKQ